MSLSKIIRCASVHSFLERGAILVLCRGQLSAVNRAVEIANELPRVPDDDFLRAVIHYLEAEAGTKVSLVSCLEHGVAYHHAGLSQEARWLVETLIKQEKVKVVCGTTTLAQGVNFPISTVIVETLRKGEVELTYQDFWNIAGRAGRALMDTLGVVAFPTPSEERLRGFEEFLRGEAEVIASQLTSIVSSADEIAGQFNLYAISRCPELSSLLQFLAHALYVSGREDVADEVEDILRASLIFHQAQQRGTKVADALIALCRSYLQSIRGQRALIGLAEQTGFATPSVFNLLGQTRGNRELADFRKWTPARLFGQDIEPLTRRIEAIANLPEIRLGQGQRPPFNARRVAEILRGWIRGDNLRDLTVNYSLSRKGDESELIGVFSNYLFSQLIVRASWGLGALETVSLGDLPEEQWKEVGYVPSMVYFGVDHREAVWLRMAGVPRIVANPLAERWLHSKVSEPANFDEIREWVSNLRDTDWQAAIPARSPLTTADLRLLCRELVG